jgi:hypothetical protein
MPKFVKNPIVIEAIQFDGSLESAKEICEWCNGSVSDDPHVDYVTFRRGDWVIQGVKGEYYPCKPDIFAETYTVC